MASERPVNPILTGDVMRFREVSGPKAKPGTIEVHIIRPGRGSSGYYIEDVLRKACSAGVYPAGMLMHWDHPSRQMEEDQPARVTGTIAAVLAESAQYREHDDPNAWDGPGPYALAEIRPKFIEDLKWLAGKIGVSHYVDGRSKEGVCPDGQKGRLITELLPSPLNSVDFVTIPGAGGHSRFQEVLNRETYLKEIIRQEGDKWVLYSSDGSKVLGTFDSEEEARDRERQIQQYRKSDESRKKMPDKQVSIRLSELMTSDPEVVAEIRKQLTDELKIDALNESQKKKFTEAEARVKTLEAENATLKMKIAEGAARDYATAEIAKAKLPETVAKTLAEALVKAVPLQADGSIDTVKFGAAVQESVKGKQAEIAAILKESGASGIHDNGGSPGQNEKLTEEKAREEYRDTLVENGMAKEMANRLAGIKERG